MRKFCIRHWRFKYCLNPTYRYSFWVALRYSCESCEREEADALYEKQHGRKWKAPADVVGEQLRRAGTHDGT